MSQRDDPQVVLERLLEGLTKGCSNVQCRNPNCASSPIYRHEGLSRNELATVALELRRERPERMFCEEFVVDARHMVLEPDTPGDLLRGSIYHYFNGDFTRLSQFFAVERGSSRYPCSVEEASVVIDRGRRALQRLRTGLIADYPVVLNGSRDAVITLASKPRLTKGELFTLVLLLLCYPNEHDSEYLDTVFLAVCQILPRSQMAPSEPPAVDPYLLEIFHKLPDPCLNVARILSTSRHWQTIMLLSGPPSHRDQANLDHTLYLMCVLWHAVRSPRSLAYRAVPHTSFYVDGINEEIDVTAEFVKFLRGQPQLLRYPFVFSLEHKVSFLKRECAAIAERESVRRSSSIFSMLFDVPRQFFVLRVKRHGDLLEQVLDIVYREIHAEHFGRRPRFRFPLKVVFVGEEAIDEGGVARELYQLLIAQLFSPNYGMWSRHDDNLVFFNRHSFETDQQFQLIGILLGLALYNGILVDVHFPAAVFRRLMGKKMGLRDLSDFRKDLFKGLTDLLEYDGDAPVEDVFCLDFSVSEEYYGTVKTVPLIPNGENIAVTKENRQQYVDAVVDYYVGGGIDRVFTPFADGFKLVAECRSLHLLTPEELEFAIIGSPQYVWEELERYAILENGYNASSTQVKWLWEVLLEDCSEEERVRFLRFVTGSGRAPVGGLKAVQLRVWRQGNAERGDLPTSHTCFNILCLPPYRTKKVLCEKLKNAIMYDEGFGFV